METDKINNSLLLDSSRIHLLENLFPFGIFRSDKDGRLLKASEGWRTIHDLNNNLQLDHDHLKTEDWLCLLRPDDRERVQEEWSNAVNSQLVFKSEYRLEAKSGKCRWILAQAAAETSSQGEVTGYFGSVMDITEKKQVDALLSEVTTQLIQADKLAGLGTLMASVAHEISNPANFIHGGAQNLLFELQEFNNILLDLASEDEDTKVRELFSEKFESLFRFISVILNGSDRINKLLLDLRNVFRVDETTKSKVKITEHLDSTLNLIRLKYKDNIDFVCDYQADPEIECWPGQLDQVFMNLMLNGCQAIRTKQTDTSDSIDAVLTVSTRLEPSVGKEPSANKEPSAKKEPSANKEPSASKPLANRNPSITERPLLKNELSSGYRIQGKDESLKESGTCDQQLIVSIKDTGYGIPRENISKIFDPFFTTKPATEGTGLGLSISYGIIEKHCGKISVDSQEGVGTEMTITLPFQ